MFEEYMYEYGGDARLCEPENRKPTAQSGGW
jgi:hypothetical protein